MHHVHVNCYINAPVEKVFDFITDNDRFFVGEGIKSVTMLREGKEVRHGLGAVRRIKSALTFEEEITVFDRPRRQEYVIRKCTIPIDHDYGRLDFIARGEGTEIDWNTYFEVKVPLLGNAIAGSAAEKLKAAFVTLLIQAKERLEG